MKIDFPSFIIGYMVGIIAFLLIIGLMGCSSAPTKSFNAEDKQDGSCYVTYGGENGYCNVIDVFGNTTYYDEFE